MIVTVVNHSQNQHTTGVSIGVSIGVNMCVMCGGMSVHSVICQPCRKYETTFRIFQKFTEYKLFRIK